MECEQKFHVSMHCIPALMDFTVITVSVTKGAGRFLVELRLLEWSTIMLRTIHTTLVPGFPMDLQAILSGDEEFYIFVIGGGGPQGKNHWIALNVQLISPWKVIIKIDGSHNMFFLDEGFFTSGDGMHERTFRTGLIIDNVITTHRKLPKMTYSITTSVLHMCSIQPFLIAVSKCFYFLTAFVGGYHDQHHGLELGLQPFPAFSHESDTAHIHFSCLGHFLWKK
ncbi:hypothetical protein ACJX0J_023019 [Zea mays]